jgi:hypothetical protein
MKKIILLFSLVLIMISFYGCPYESKVPISDPTIKISDDFIGEWNYKDTKTRYIISKDDDYHMKITSIPVDSISKDTAVYIAHISKIKDYSFLNITKVAKENNFFSSGVGTYYLYRIVKSGKNEMTLKEVTNNIKEKFESSKELYSYIEKYMDLSFFYGTEENYIKN